jgi:hypothetical protein
VYIIGETIQVVRRFSLPDVNTYDLLNNVGIYRLPRVSCAAASADDADLDPLIAGEICAVLLSISRLVKNHVLFSLMQVTP